MRYLYPITTELVTLTYATSQGLERSLKAECGLSVLQFRILSYLRQNDGVREPGMSNALQASVSQLSQNLSKLVAAGHVEWVAAGGSARSWHLTADGRCLLEDADIALVDTYDRFFSGLDRELHEKVRAGLRLTSQAQGFMRVRDATIFDELAYFESILASEHISTNSLQRLGLAPAQFRIVYELLERGPQTKAGLSRALLLARSTVTWTCDSLCGRGLLAGGGKRSNDRAVSLTAEGRELAERAAGSVDRAWFEARVWSPEERENNQKAAEFFVRKHCT